MLVLHGGPGAIGYVAPVARALGAEFRVLEPFQRRSSAGEQLTVARHIADLHELITACCPDGPPALVGSSWGAMLALAYGAAHPEACGPLVLIGCGTFDTEARHRMHATIAERTDEQLRRRLRRLASVSDPDERLERLANLLLPIYSCDLATTDLELVGCDAQGQHETWTDMLRLERQGIYPAALAALCSPVLMLHGAADPHPGQLIRASLEPYVARLQYCEWERCGHYPWLERAVRDELPETLRRWLRAAVRPSPVPAA